MPHVLDRHGLSLEQEPESVPPLLGTKANELLDIMTACIESALAG